jgi:hypothetical protein
VIRYVQHQALEYSKAVICGPITHVVPSSQSEPTVFSVKTRPASRIAPGDQCRTVPPAQHRLPAPGAWQYPRPLVLPLTADSMLFTCAIVVFLLALHTLLHYCDSAGSGSTYFAHTGADGTSGPMTATLTPPLLANLLALHAYRPIQLTRVDTQTPLFAASQPGLTQLYRQSTPPPS